MPKDSRRSRPGGEIKRELVEQLQLLRHACASFDNGLEGIGKHIALSLRVLLHHRGQSQSLLAQLQLRSMKFFDSAGPLNPRNLLTECNLVAMKMTSTGGRYLPLIAAFGGAKPMVAIPFERWWNDPVLKDKKKQTLCRRTLVSHVADTDGGAHVDPKLDEAYMAISRSNSLGWEFSDGTKINALEGRPELACMRQIAHEVLSTLYSRHDEFSAHAEPVLPTERQPD